MLHLRDAALQLGISFPTIKQWIYRKKIHSIQTPGGHHRIPQTEVDKLLFRTRGKTEKERELVVRRVSGRNQLVGRIDSVRISGLMAEVKISIGGQQITSIITATSAREMQLKKGPNRRRPDQGYRSDDHPRMNVCLSGQQKAPADGRGSPHKTCLP